MKVWIESDEWYPVYTIEPENLYDRNAVEMSAEDVADFARVRAEFEDWQDRLAYLADKAEGRLP